MKVDTYRIAVYGESDVSHISLRICAKSFCCYAKCMGQYYVTCSKCTFGNYWEYTVAIVVSFDGAFPSQVMAGGSDKQLPRCVGRQ